MSATIYSAPTEIKTPDLFSDPNWEASEKKYIKEVKAHILKCGYKGKNVGEVLRFGVADGYALYMVMSMRPLALIHLSEICDGYRTGFAHLLTAKEVNKRIESEKRMAKLFS